MNFRIITAILSLAVCTISMTGCHHHHHSSRKYDAHDYRRDKAVYSTGYERGYREAKKDRHYNNRYHNPRYTKPSDKKSSWWSW